MTTTAKALLQIMTVRLGLLDDGVIRPTESVALATRKLVENLRSLQIEDEIEIEILERDPLWAKYVHKESGRVLAEIRS
jgi:hypothetical protein